MRSATATPSSSRLVREHRPANDVADRPDVLEVGPAVVVDRHEAALVERRGRPLRRSARSCSARGRSRRSASRRPAPAPCRRHRCTSTATPSAPVFTSVILTPSTTFSPCRVNALCASVAICVSTAPRKVGSASRIVTCGAEPAPDRSHLEADHARADDAERLRHRVDRRARRRWRGSARSSNGGAGQGARVRAGGDDDVLRVSVSGFAPATAISQPPSPFFTNEPRPWKNWILFFLKR